jgi:S-formylglutathione hydrolase FrmB
MHSWEKATGMSDLQVGWSEVSVGGHPCDVFQPASPNPHGYVLIYLHGVHLHRLTDKVEFNDQFEQHGVPVIAPMTGRSWWTDRICPEFDSELTAEQHLLRNVLPYVKERWGAEPPRIGLFGTSMGGQGALRFAYKYPNIFPVSAAISPAIDYQYRWEDGDEMLQRMYPDPESARQETALLYVHPLNWPRHQFFCCDPTDHRWWDGADRLRMKLSSLGIPYDCDLETSGGGHSFAYYGRMAERAISFMMNGLQRERLGLPIQR